MSLNIDIGRKEAIFFGVIILVFVFVGLVVGFGGLVVGFGGTEPSVMGHSAGELDGVCLSDGTNCPVSMGGSVPLKFEVYNSDTSTYVCVEQDLEEYCGDEDGCTIRLLLQHETEGSDQVRIIDEHIYMEQTSLSNNLGAGIYGWTRQGGGGEYSWITGSTGQYDIASPWGWVWIKNYKHDWCEGQVGNGPAFTNPYTFSFMSHADVRTNIIVYDSVAG